MVDSLDSPLRQRVLKTTCSIVGYTISSSGSAMRKPSSVKLNIFAVPGMEPESS